MQMMKKRRRFYLGLVGSVAALFSVAFLVSCGGSSMTSMTASTSGTVITTLSDPPTCKEHVFVTITKVTANFSATAGSSDSGWQTLVDLSGSPMQVDLSTLNPTAQPGFCGTLFKLGSGPLPAGKYQQIRLYLLANNAASGPSNDSCNGAGWNCVIPDGSTTPQELTLPSEVQTGIKIPASQISSGGLTVTAGQSVDLNIDINSCASIVKAGNSGKYLLKPVLHADEVTLNNNNLSGTVIEANTRNEPSPGAPVAGALVLLENGITSVPLNGSTATRTDQVVMSALTNSDGTFDFCPLPPDSNTFDVVVTGQTAQGSGVTATTTTYNPSVVLGVPVGGSAGNIPLYAETTTGSDTGLVSTTPAVISGQITSTSATSTPVAGSVQISAFQSVTSGSNTVNLTIPIFTTDPNFASTPADNLSDSQPPTFTTVATPDSACADTTMDCVVYSIPVPASAVAVGNYDSTAGNTVTAPTATDTATYTINALADGSNGLLNCSTSSTTSDPVTATPGTTTDQTAVPSLTFTLTGCSAPTTP